jgi:hypothetical protein
MASILFVIEMLLAGKASDRKQNQKPPNTPPRRQLAQWQRHLATSPLVSAVSGNDARWTRRRMPARDPGINHGTDEKQGNASQESDPR